MNVFARVLDHEPHGFWAFVCDDSDVSRLSLQISRTLVIFFATVVCHCRGLESCCFSSEVSERVEFVGDVQENDEFETPRLDRAAYVFCVQKCKSVMMDSTELPSSSKRVSDGNEAPFFFLKEGEKEGTSVQVQNTTRNLTPREGQNGPPAPRQLWRGWGHPPQRHSCVPKETNL